MHPLESKFLENASYSYQANIALQIAHHSRRRDLQRILDEPPLVRWRKQDPFSNRAGMASLAQHIEQVSGRAL